MPIISHCMTVISHPTHCQPNRRFSLHLNNHIHITTTNTHIHHPIKFTINLHINPNNPFVLYTYFFPDKESTTAVIHLVPPTRNKYKRQRRSRATPTFSNTTQTNTLSTSPSPLHQNNITITVTHLVITAPQPGGINWNIV